MIRYQKPGCDGGRSLIYCRQNTSPVATSSKGHMMELNGFCDASEQAYPAVLYLRMMCADGNIQIALVASKTKVAPIKGSLFHRLSCVGHTSYPSCSTTSDRCLICPSPSPMLGPTAGSLWPPSRDSLFHRLSCVGHTYPSCSTTSDRCLICPSPSPMLGPTAGSLETRNDSSPTSATESQA